jgi:hypothetical protein
MMKKLLLLNIILAALSTPVSAATVKAIATDVKATWGDFSQTPGGTALSNGDIGTIISSDPATAIYGFSSADYSVIDLGFGDSTVVTGAGADLVIFSLSSGYNYSFGLQAYDTENNLLSSYNYSTATHSSIFSPGILATSINLYDGSVAVGDDIELGYVRLFIGGTAYNGSVGGTDAYSNFSLVGAYHTQAAVVPLPISAVLFSSGLALLGWVGRRKSL